MMSWSRICTVAVGVPLIVVGLLYGCSSDRPDANGATATPPKVTPIDEGACDVEGQSRECHVPISVQDGIRSCLSGTQTCQNKRWTVCGQTGGTISGKNIELALNTQDIQIVQGLRPQTHLDAGLVEAGACANPCDPSCLGYDEDAGPLTTDASLDAASGIGLAATNAGQQAKLLHDKNTGWGADCEKWETNTNSTGHVHSACQGDYYCARHSSVNGNDGRCAQFNEGPMETHAGKLDAQASGAVACRDSYPDLTLAVPCSIGAVNFIPICNRGSAPLASGTTIALHGSGGLVSPTAPTNTNIADAADPASPGCPVLATSCTFTTTAALNPGSCVRADLTSCGLSGNKGVYVNANRAIRECVIQTNLLGNLAPPVNQHSPAKEQDDQYGCANNYTDFSSSSVPVCPSPVQAPKSVTFPYNGICPLGKEAQWGKLAWNSLTPPLTNIGFDVRTRRRLPDGGFGAWTPWVTVGKANSLGPTTDDPAICLMTGPGPKCPKDLYAGLLDAGGLGGVRGEALELRVNLNPVAAAGPTLYAYYLAYSCVDNE